MGDFILCLTRNIVSYMSCSSKTRISLTGSEVDTELVVMLKLLMLSGGGGIGEWGALLRWQRIQRVKGRIAWSGYETTTSIMMMYSHTAEWQNSPT